MLGLAYFLFWDIAYCSLNFHWLCWLNQRQLWVCLNNNNTVHCLQFTKHTYIQLSKNPYQIGEKTKVLRGCNTSIDIRWLKLKAKSFIS